ncbi:MAG: hypothetical protein JWN93_511 [Hyphomicrobiales bacterium]|nr:hypothetical protein [Hyphomicrobiales bacterium]
MTMTKLPRTIRLDPSDTFVFERAADAGEWAVSGSFLFAHSDPEAMSPKERAAFRSGFLGVRTLGFSTLAVVVDATGEDRAEAVETLAGRFLTLGAPDAGQARQAAEEEIAFAASLCEHPEGTLLAVERRMEAGEIRERFRTLKPRETVPGADRLHALSRAFTFYEIEGEEPDAQERVDLVSLMKKDGA